MMEPSTGQSRLPRSLVVIAPVVAVATPRDSASRRARSSASTRSWSARSARSSPVSRCSPARALPLLDAIGERSLVAIEPREPLLRFPRVAPRLAQVRFALMLEREVAAQLVRALDFAVRERLAGVHQQLALPGYAIAQLLHVVGQQAILATDEKEVLVARQQVAEALGGEQELPAVQRPALVDVHQPPLQHGALFEQRVLRDQEIDGDLVDLRAEAADLAVELIDDAVGALLLLLDVGDFVGEGMRLRPEALEL